MAVMLQTVNQRLIHACSGGSVSQPACRNRLAHSKEPSLRQVGQSRVGRQASPSAAPQIVLHAYRPADADLQHSSIILVEGLADCKAVQRAVSATVVVVGGAYAAKHAKLRDELAQLGGPARSQIILLDPDQEGRKARLLLADMFPEALHAFVPWDLAQASKTSRRHSEGNIGIEHASPEAIRLALDQARPCNPSACHILREDLVARGLVADFGQAGEAAGAASRRRRLCERLGLGNVPGKHLQKLLNMFGFTMQEIDAAMVTA